MQSILDCKLEDLKTESDVEQKFIVPLLLSLPPLGLNYNPSDFRTKPDIREVKIDKGNNIKLYYPDYVIINSGLPLVVIEAKKPGEDLKEAYREARLYCIEINSQFPHGINPCQKIMVTNGETSLVGYHDSDTPAVSLNITEIDSVNPNFFDFTKFLSKVTMVTAAEGFLKKLRGETKFSRPLSLVGGKVAQNVELKENTFGNTLSLEFRYLFNPESYEERRNVILNAYVRTKRHLKQVDPIDKIIRATLPLSLSDIRTIEDTTQPIELIAALQKRRVLKNQLLLLVGSVGSGKSTFTDYLKEEALSEELRKETIWISCNLNQAPLNKIEIYNWLKIQIVEKLKYEHRDIDFDDFNNLKKVYSVELNATKKTYAPILGEESTEYRKILAQTIMDLKGNLDSSSKAFTRYLCTERNKLLVVVLDNSDKRKADDQLLMFEVASWLKETMSCLVFLPIRDTTFDNFKKEPPLDTVIKDLVFRIDPPLLREVIMARIKYALREMDKTSNKLSFYLPNGIPIEYPATDQGFYLASIARSLFENIYFSRLITGLAGRNIRKGLEMFLDFCKSGHLNEAEIYKIKRAQGQYTLPNHLISLIILRGNKKYFSDSNLNVKNIFKCFIEDIIPDPFIRLSILRWLKANFKKTGPTKNIGYHKIEQLVSDLKSFGHSSERINSELDFLIRNKYVVTESQSEENYDFGDLISLAPPGHILLELVGDFSYLAACSEDMLYSDNSITIGIHKRITEKLGNSHYSKETTMENAKTLVDYLEKYKSEFLNRKPEIFLNDQAIMDLTNLEKQREAIGKVIQYDENLLKQLKYSYGTEIEGEIVAIKDYGIFVEFGLDAVGFIHISELTMAEVKTEDLDLGDIVKAKVKRFNVDHQRYDLEALDE